jgi:DNA topoisomerase-1
MALVIVESPNKIKTIQKYLKQIGEELKDNMIKNASVLASAGHITNISNNFNKDDYIVAGIKNNYDIEYIPIESKQNIIDNIKKSAKTAKIIYLATDMDLEGHRISKALTEVIGTHNYKRILFNEITLSALTHAFKKQGSIDKKKLDAQKSRQILDKVIGYKLSQFLWNFISYDKYNPISAGRVQSAVLSLIDEKQKEIEKVSDTNFWKPVADFKIKGITHQLNNCDIYHLDKDTSKYNKCQLDNENDVKNFWKKYKKEFYIPSYKVSTSTSNPPKPYMTSTLLRDSSTKLGMSLDKTTKLAQNLYEAGLITYIRTDHAVISDEFKPKIRDFILETFDDTYFNHDSMLNEDDKKKNSKKKKSDKKKEDETAQEAHECIRPTDLSIDIDAITDNNINNSHKRLYNLIKKTTIASMMTPAIYDTFTINIHTIDDKYMSKAQLKGIKFKGFKILDDIMKMSKVSKKDKNEDKDEDDEGIDIDNNDNTIDIEKLKNIIDKCINDKKCDNVKVLKIFLNHTYTTPPSHYTKVGLVDLMKNTGLGRPSTYLNLTNVLFDRNYCSEMNVNGPDKEFITYEWKSTKPNDIKENKTIAPLYTRKNVIQITERGRKVNEILMKNFKDLINVDFTANMEFSLNEIAEGELKYLDFVKSICDTFIKKYDELLIKYQNDDGKIKKTTIGREKVSLEFEGINYDLMIDKFGNDTLTYEENGERKYINVKNYLKYSHKNVRELDDNDIQFLKSLPIEVNKNITLKIGPYGLYAIDKKNKKNIPIYLKYLPNILQKDYTILTNKK